jgi:hypothetical protein
MRALIILLASAFAVSAEWLASENAGRSRSRPVRRDHKWRDCPNKEQHVPRVFDAGKKIDPKTLTLTYNLRPMRCSS